MKEGVGNSWSIVQLDKSRILVVKHDECFDRDRIALAWVVRQYVNFTTQQCSCRMRGAKARLKKTILFLYIYYKSKSKSLIKAIWILDKSPWFFLRSNLGPSFLVPTRTWRKYRVLFSISLKSLNSPFPWTFQILMNYSSLSEYLHQYQHTICGLTDTTASVKSFETRLLNKWSRTLPDIFRYLYS